MISEDFFEKLFISIENTFPQKQTRVIKQTSASLIILSAINYSFARGANYYYFGQ